MPTPPPKAPPETYHNQESHPVSVLLRSPVSPLCRYSREALRFLVCRNQQKQEWQRGTFLKPLAAAEVEPLSDACHAHQSKGVGVAVAPV